MKTLARLQRRLDVLYEASVMRTRNRRGSLAEQSGQAMIEYVVTMLLAVLGLIGVGNLMHASLGRYLLEIYFMTSLPIP